MKAQFTLWATVLASVISLSGCGTVSPRPALSTATSELSAEIAFDGSRYEVLLGGTVCGSFTLPMLVGCGLPAVEITSLEGGWHHVRLRWNPAVETAQDDLSVVFALEFEPDLWWAPHLAPYEGYVVAQHVFRAPALIVQQGVLTLALVPDLDVVGRRPENPWYLDYDAPQRMLRVGMTRTEVPGELRARRTNQPRRGRDGCLHHL